jgi:hypothetical protein
VVAPALQPGGRQLVPACRVLRFGGDGLLVVASGPRWAREGLLLGGRRLDRRIAALASFRSLFDPVGASTDACGRGL